MQEETQEHTDEGQETPDIATSREPESSLAEELRSLGKNLAAALMAAGRTEEAEALKADLREGMRTLRGEIDQALSGPGVDALRHKAQSTRSGQVRVEAAGAVRSLNRVLERLAGSLEPSVAESTPAAQPERVEGAGAPAEDDRSPES